MNWSADKSEKPAAVPSAPPPSLVELIGRSEGGLSFADLQAATGQSDADLQTTLDALGFAGKIAVGVNNGTLCYRCV